jgi:predicted CopG family antitoxin
MGTLSIVVDDQVLQKAFLRATKQGISFNTLLRRFLERDEEDTELLYRQATTRLLELAQKSTAASKKFIIIKNED